jgi:capsular exopolysaccharide synthesis family protein
MEKIQQAIEKARQQRENAGMHSSHNQSSAKEVSSIEYSQTKLMEGRVEHQREKRILSAMAHSQYADAFKILSTQVMQRMVENHWNSLIVTSVGGNEGKTTTAINLGISIAREIEYSVLLVDGNLRKPDLHNYFGIKPEFGLSDYLTSDLDLADVLVRPNDIDHFVLLPGGQPLINSTEMLGSPKMCSLAEELKNRYPKRIVIFDMPPVLNVADTVSFSPCVDCALLVVEDDVTKETELQQAIDLMSVTNIIGTVLNKARY